MTPRTVSLAIFPQTGQPPSREFNAIPWFPGMRVLDALVLADAMLADDFVFRAIYGSAFGVFIDRIDGIADTASEFWMLYIDNVPAERGVSETLLLNDGIAVTFRFEQPPASHPQSDAKAALAGSASAR
jgi:hypothetical protein